jgi:hypothetical protein
VNPGHLYLGDHADNMRDMRARGRSLAGEKNVHSRLTNDAVREIRRSFVSHDHERGGSALARKFGVKPSAVHRVVLGQRWKTVK